MTRSLRRHLNFANVVSMLALFVALGGTSYSAIKLTGADVRNGSLTGKDVRNRSLGKQELSRRAVRSLAGKAGPQGPRGLRGPRGARGGAAPVNSIRSANIVNGSIAAVDLGANSVDSSKVVNNSLTTADVAGADVNGATIDLSAGAVADGRCGDFPLAVAGATAGEAVVLSIQGAAPPGVLIHGTRVPSNGTVTMKVCNLTGGAMAAIANLPVRVITFGS